MMLLKYFEEENNVSDSKGQWVYYYSNISFNFDL